MTTKKGEIPEQSEEEEEPIENYETLPSTKKPTTRKKQIIKKEISESKKRRKSKYISENPILTIISPF